MKSQAEVSPGSPYLFLPADDVGRTSHILLPSLPFPRKWVGWVKGRPESITTADFQLDFSPLKTRVHLHIHIITYGKLSHTKKPNLVLLVCSEFVFSCLVLKDWLKRSTCHTISIYFMLNWEVVLLELEKSSKLFFYFHSFKDQIES